MATVVLSKAAAKSFAELPLPIQGRVTKLLERLRSWPEPVAAKALSGKLAGRYRLRTGDYRVQFYVETTRSVEIVPAPAEAKKRSKTEERIVLHHKVVIERIGHRDGFYE